VRGDNVTIEESRFPLKGISLQQYTNAIKEYGYDSLEALKEAVEAYLEELAATRLSV
jgi:hypothetical protein